MMRPKKRGIRGLQKKVREGGLALVNLQSSLGSREKVFLGQVCLKKSPKSMAVRL